MLNKQVRVLPTPLDLYNIEVCRVILLLSSYEWLKWKLILGGLTSGSIENLILACHG